MHGDFWPTQTQAAQVDAKVRTGRQAGPGHLRVFGHLADFAYDRLHLTFDRMRYGGIKPRLTRPTLVWLLTAAALVIQVAVQICTRVLAPLLTLSVCPACGRHQQRYQRLHCEIL